MVGIDAFKQFYATCFDGFYSEFFMSVYTTLFLFCFDFPELLMKLYFLFAVLLFCDATGRHPKSSKSYVGFTLLLLC